MAQLPTLLHDLRYVSSDLILYTLLWYQHILDYGALASLEGSYANYSPPFLYLLSLVSSLKGMASNAVLIKLVTIPFILASGWLAYDICLALHTSKRRAVAFGALVLVTPEIWRNSFAWGQCDIIYTCFLLAFYRLMLARKTSAAMLVFGTAIAFKLQAIFMGPVLFALLLTGELSLWQFLLIPVAYVIWMIPAGLAGRPWKELLLVYAGQYEYYSLLGMHVPNPFFMIQNWVPSRHAGMASKAGILLAAMISLGVSLRYVLRRRLHNPVGLLMMITLCMLMEPYLLPKMHDRYFFAGDVFAILLVAVRFRMWVPALLLQVTSFITYRQFLHDQIFVARSKMVIPFITISIALFLIARAFWKEGEVSDEEGPDRVLAAEVG